MRMTSILGAGLAAGLLLALILARPSSTPVFTQTAPKGSRVSIVQPTRGTMDSVLKGAPAARLIGLAQWAAGASRADLLEAIAQKPESLTLLEWRVLLIRWAELDPENFVEEALGLTKDDEPYHEDIVWEILAEVDLKRAASLAKTKGHILKAQHGDIGDPQQMIAWLESADVDRETRENLLPDAYKSWLVQDRKAAMRSIEALADNDLKEKLLAVAAEVWTRENPEQAFAWAMEISKNDRDLQHTMVRAVFDTLQAGNRDDAWTFLKAHGNQFPIGVEDHAFHSSLLSIIDRAAYLDPGNVIDWISSLEDERAQRGIILSTTALSMRLTDPNQWIERLPEGEVRETFAARIISQHHSSVSDRIVQIKTLEGVDQDHLLATTLESSSYQPEEIAATFDEWKHLPEARRFRIMENSIRVWAAESPSEAAAWISKLPHDMVSPQHFNAAWSTWTKLEPKAASQALANLDPGPLQDAAVSGLIDQIALGPRVVSPDFEAAWQWAQTLGDVGTREPLMNQLETQWRQHDAEAAAAHLDQ